MINVDDENLEKKADELNLEIENNQDEIIEEDSNNNDIILQNTSENPGEFNFHLNPAYSKIKDTVLFKDKFIREDEKDLLKFVIFFIFRL